MKKNYITPATIVTKVVLESMLASSTEMGIGGNIDNEMSIGVRESGPFSQPDAWEW